MADVLPTLFQHLIFKLLKHLNDLSIEIEELEKQIQLWHRQNLASQKIADVS
jgi:transposase